MLIASRPRGVDRRNRALVRPVRGRVDIGDEDLRARVFLARTETHALDEIKRLLDARALAVRPINKAMRVAMLIELERFSAIRPASRTRSPRAARSGSRGRDGPGCAEAEKGAVAIPAREKRDVMAHHREIAGARLPHARPKAQHRDREVRAIGERMSYALEHDVDEVAAPRLAKWRRIALPDPATRLVERIAATRRRSVEGARGHARRAPAGMSVTGEKKLADRRGLQGARRRPAGGEGRSSRFSYLTAPQWRFNPRAAC